MSDFEKIILQCILYHNSKRIVERFPYTKQMITEKVYPTSNGIWNYSMNQPGANLISIDHPALMRTLLPRATGKFSRYGLKVNNLRYRNDDFTEQYLAGGTATVAYNPDDVSEVWLIDKGKYIPFTLVETRFRDASLSDVDSVREGQKTLARMGRDANKQAQIDLIAHIETIASNAANHGDTRIQDIRKTRNAERTKSHFSILKGGDICDQRA